MTGADLSEARRLLGCGLRLVKMKPFTKQPDGFDWNLRPVTSIDPDATGYGLILAQNKLCSIDPDNIEVARVGMKALGFDLDALMDAGVRTRSTRAGSGGRSTFAADGEIAWLKFSCGRFGTVIEFRADSPNLQDTIPGIVYRDKADAICRQEYANCKRLDDAPALPDELLEWWELCSTDVDYFRKQQERFFEAVALQFGERPDAIRAHKAISTGRGGVRLAFDAPGVRGAFNREHTVPEILTRHGYTYHPSLDRWSCPTASGAPGIREIPDHEGLWRSDHASDPLHGTFDAWTAHVVLDHGGDLQSALAARQPKPPPTAADDPGFSAEDDLPPPRDSGSTKVDDERAEPLPEAGPALKQAAQIAATYVRASWLLRPFLERQAMILMFGALGTLKSFLALHWSLLVAETGVPVIYLHAEGRGLWARLRAWAKHSYPAEPWDIVLGRLPFYALEQPLNLSDEDSVTWLRLQIAAIGIVPGLVVVDTLSRNSDGLVERSNEDAVGYLNRLDRVLRTELKASILFVHHPGHNAQHRSRGPYSLMANTDANFLIERPDERLPVIRITSGRMKDSETPPPAEMRAVVVEVGESDDLGRPITSLAFVRETAPVAPSKPKAQGKNQQRALAAITEWARQNPGARSISSGDVAALLNGQGVGSKRRPEVLNYLVAARILTASVGGFTLDPEML